MILLSLFVLILICVLILLNLVKLNDNICIFNKNVIKIFTEIMRIMKEVEEEDGF